MNLDQLLGRHARLERELAIAFGTQPWPGARIERLAEELAAADDEIARLRRDGALPSSTPSPEETSRQR